MISYIKGEVVEKGLDYVVIDNNNMGYFINTSALTTEKLREGDKAKLLTYMHIREDIVALYGFLNHEEIEIFKKLITVNGIGVRVGLAILSTYEANKVREMIIREDADKISKVPGIGKKTASKIILELKDKVGTLNSVSSLADDDKFDDKTSDESDVLNVLVTLGFSLVESKKALNNILPDGKSENEIIKEALKYLNRQV